MQSAGFPPARPRSELALTSEILPSSRARAEVSALLGRVAVLLLSGFHAWLFWSHLAGGRLLEPAVASRWVAGVLLTAGFLGLRRVGVPLVRGRKAVVLWLLVALLHVHAAWAPQGTIADRGAMDEAVATIVLQAASAAALLGLGLVLLAVTLRPKTRAFRSPTWFAQHAGAAGRPSDGWSPLLSPRPPPLG
jgi:hypothetical protein